MAIIDKNLYGTKQAATDSNNPTPNEIFSVGDANTLVSKIYALIDEFVRIKAGDELTTIAQLKALTDTIIDPVVLDSKADLVAGKLNPAQLPDLAILVTIETAQTSLSDYILNEWIDGVVQKGDLVVLTTAGGSIEVWRLKSGTGAASSDYQKIDASKVALANVIGAGLLAALDAVAEGNLEAALATKINNKKDKLPWSVITSTNGIALTAGQLEYRFTRTFVAADGTAPTFSLGTQEAAWVQIELVLWNNDTVDRTLTIPAGYYVKDNITNTAQGSYATGQLTIKAGGEIEMNISQRNGKKVMFISDIGQLTI